MRNEAVSDHAFDPALREGLRREIERAGVVVDAFLAEDADCPVYGLNLACAYPFPSALKDRYEVLHQPLSALGPEVYVYPFWQTHVTIMTFVNFTRHQRPTADGLRQMGALARQLIATLEPLFVSDGPEAIRPFELFFQAPALSRRAGYLPVVNPTGEIRRMRERALGLLRSNPTLHGRLDALGLTVPGIIHSTVLRFVRAPADLARFLATFDRLAAEPGLGSARISEILVTAETRPYMRSGEVLHRFRLGSS